MLSLVPSSQISVPTIIESPQLKVHVVGGPIVQVKPASSPQLPEQPSLDAVLASSQASAPTMIESPQTVLQAEGNPGHNQPFSTTHELEQPSRFTVFESSHPSI